MNYTLEVTIKLLAPTDELRKIGFDKRIMIRKSFKLPYLPDRNAPPLKICAFKTLYFNENPAYFNPETGIFEAEITAFDDVPITAEEIQSFLDNWRDNLAKIEKWEWIEKTAGY